MMDVRTAQLLEAAKALSGAIEGYPDLDSYSGVPEALKMTNAALGAFPIEMAPTATKHRKEPWRVDSHPRVVEDASGMFIARIQGQFEDAEADANAERIVACVNACAGMPNPATDIANALGRVLPHWWPMTKDGMPIFPKKTLHFPSGVQATVLAVWFDGTLDLQSHDDEGIPTNGWKRLQAEKWGYASPKAAEAARKPSADGKGA